MTKTCLYNSLKISAWRSSQTNLKNNTPGIITFKISLIQTRTNLMKMKLEVAKFNFQFNQESGFYQQDNNLNVIMEAPDEESQQSSKNLIQQHDKNQKDYEEQIAYLSGDTYNLPIQLLKDNTTKIEAEKKSQKLRTFCEIMKEKEKDKKRLEERFQHLLREQAVYLINEDKQKKIEKALERTIKPEKIKPAIQNMLSEQKQPALFKPLPQISKEKEVPTKKERFILEQNDQLKKEIERLKQENNENLEIIKTLKIQINKFQLAKDFDSTTNSSTISRGSNKTKSEVMQVGRNFFINIGRNRTTS